ncbi:hypothetical protein DFAR_1170003 [Desulfarculales bacterium]
MECMAHCPGIRSNLQKDLVWLFIGVHTLSHQPPGRGCNPRPRVRSPPASMIASCFNSAMWIAPSWHRNYTNSNHDDEEAFK